MLEGGLTLCERLFFYLFILFGEGATTTAHHHSALLHKAAFVRTLPEIYPSKGDHDKHLFLSVYESVCV